MPGRITRKTVAVAAAALVILASFALALSLALNPSSTFHALKTTCSPVQAQVGIPQGFNCWTPDPNQTIASQPDHGCWLVDPAFPSWGYDCVPPAAAPTASVSK